MSLNTSMAIMANKTLWKIPASKVAAVGSTILSSPGEKTQSNIAKGNPQTPGHNNSISLSFFILITQLLLPQLAQLIEHW